MEIGIDPKRPSLREVARLAGVSTGTVSNYLNHPDVVAEATRDRIRSVIRETGWIPNSSGRTLRLGRSSLIGLVVPDISNPFYTDIARGAESVAARHGYSVVLCNANDDATAEARYLRVLEEHRIAGLLITPAKSDESYLVPLVERGMRVALLDRPATTTDLPSVVVDNVAGGDMAARHLLGLGHRRIVVVTPPVDSMRQYKNRLAGVERAVRHAGLDPMDCIDVVVTRRGRISDGEQAVDRLLQDGADPPSSVFCVNDLLAVGVVRSLIEHRVRVPDQTSVVGFDDIEIARQISPSLSTIRQPRYELGQAAMEMLISGESEDTGSNRRVTFTPELIERESTSQRHALSGTEAAVRNKNDRDEEKRV